MKLCAWCHKNIAKVPINRGPGRFLKQICSECHAKRLQMDLKNILKIEQDKYKHDNSQKQT